jgi:hypothetical protein
MIHVEYDSDPSASEKKKTKKNTIFRQINYTTSKCERTKINIFLTEFQAFFQPIGGNKREMIP